MRQLLTLGRQSGGSGYYVHTGDLDWWLYYVEPGSELWPYIYLWESEAGEGVLDGWALLSPAWSAFDVFVRPELRGSPQAEAMYAFADGRLTEIVRGRGGNEIRTIWVGEGDDILIPYLDRCGFSLGESFIQQYARLLDPPPALPPLPVGFRLGNVDGEEIARSRAAASQAAFGSDWESERYLRRYLNFRRSLVYRSELDVVALAPDGRVASFCLVWLDLTNRVGLFEPVGTAPDFQRMGLGRAALAEGMRRMATCGMRSAIVCALGEDAAANGIYRSAGMQPVRRLLTYNKPV